MLATVTTKLAAQCGLMYEYPNDAVKCTNKDYFYYAPSGYSNYNWTIINGTKTGGGTSSTYWVSVKWDQPGSSRMVSVSYASGCNSSFYVTNMPAAPVITGPATVCHNTTRTYSVPSGTTCTWSVMSGSNLIQSTTTSGTGNINFNITWKPNVTGFAQIAVERDQTSGCKTKGFYFIQVENGVGTISGSNPANSGITYTYTAGSGSNYNWTVTGGTLIDPQGFSTMRIKWNCNIASGSVSVTYNSNAGCAKTASMNPVSLTPVMPTLTPVDGYSASEYCYKAARSFVTESGYSSYTWTISGQLEGPWNGGTATHSITQTGSNAHIFSITPTISGATRYFYGSVNIKVRYDLGGGCNSSEKTQVMTVTPASVAFRGSTTAVPIVCYSDSQNIGDYSTDAGFTNYSWTTGDVANVGKGSATNPNAQTTNINWINPTTITTPPGLTGGTVPVIVTYSKTALNCTNTNLARNGVNIRKPALSGLNPQQVTVGVPAYFTSANSDGYEWSWAITPSNFGRFTDQSGNTLPPPTTEATYITMDINNEPDPFPTVSVNYWIYYPQVGGTRISYCTATKQVDIRACSSCNSRKASDIASNNEEPIESGAFHAYPIPADNELWLHNVPIGASIRMVSINGAEVISTAQDQESHIKKLETGSLSSGVYLLRTVDIDNQPVSLRVIIRH